MYSECIWEICIGVTEEDRCWEVKVEGVKVEEVELCSVIDLTPERSK